MKSTYLLILITIFLAGCSAMDTKDLDQLYINGRSNLHSQEGISSIKRCAKFGHGGCAQILGGMYYNGTAIKKDLGSAVNWQLAAWETGIDYGYAGILGALRVAQYYCDEPYFSAPPQKVEIFLNSANDILNIYFNSFSENRKNQENSTADGIRSEISQIRNRMKAGECAGA